ncbi:MAG: type II toxin-antitoxin system PemK/MazF family toxin [Nitrospirota bacterium]
MTDKNFPVRGEIWLVDFNPSRGHEQAGIRPALIIQNDVINRTRFGTVVILAISKLSDVKRRGILNIEIKKGEGGLTMDSVVKCHQIYTIDVNRLMKRFGKLNEKYMQQIEDAVKIVLDFIKL